MNVDLISTCSPPVFRFLNAKLGSTSRFYQGLNDGVIAQIPGLHMELHNSGVFNDANHKLPLCFISCLASHEILQRSTQYLKNQSLTEAGSTWEGGGVLGAWELSTSQLACRHPRLLLSPTSLSTSVPSPDLLPTHAMGLSPLQSSF